MLHEHLLDLRRIDIDATCNDQVLGPVAQEQPAVFIQIADIAHGEQFPMTAFLRLGRVLVVFKLPDHGFHVDIARLTGRHGLARIVEDADFRARPGFAHRTRLLEPVR